MPLNSLPSPVSHLPKGRVNEKPSAFDQVIRQFIRVRARLWKIGGQHVANFANGFDQGITKLLVAEMRADSLDNALPELVAAFFVNRRVANDGEFVNTWRDKNEHRIALARLVHTEPMKLFPRRNERITL